MEFKADYGGKSNRKDEDDSDGGDGCGGEEKIRKNTALIVNLE